VVDCPGCQINFQEGIHDGVIISIKDKHDPKRGWLEICRGATDEDKQLRASLADFARRTAKDTENR
jgi:hypothetical protein